MKKILILFLMCCPILCAAQSEWEIPNAEKPSNEVKKEKKTTSKEANAETANENIKDWEYIKEGAVPEVDGKIVFSYDIDVPGKTAQEIYDLAYVALDSLAHTEEQIKSNIALINRKEHMIAARYREWLEFSKSFIALDRTEFSYNYEEGRSTGLKTTAEKWISDKQAVNKKRTKLIPGTAKFRKKTIDRKNAIFKYIAKKVKGIKEAKED